MGALPMIIKGFKPEARPNTGGPDPASSGVAETAERLAGLEPQ